MEHSINVTGEVKLSFPDLVKAAEIIAGALKGTASMSEIETDHSVVNSTTKVVNKVEAPSEIKLEASSSKHLHYGQKQDGATYTQWDDMCKALDKAGPERAQQILAELSENGTYGGVKPADWNKVIEACNEKKETKDSTPAVTYTNDDCLKACRAFIEKNDKHAMRDIFRRLGVEKLPDLPVERYPELMQMVGADNA